MTDVVVNACRQPPVGLVCYVPTPSRPLLVEPGERLYIVHDGALWGWCEIVDVEPLDRVTKLALGQVTRCTLPCRCRSFDGYRYRWWDRVAERYHAEHGHHQRTG